MARTSFSDIFYASAPGAKARDEADALLNTELEGSLVPKAKPAPQAGSWRATAPGTFVRDDPSTGTVTTVENSGGTVFSKVERYTPPPVDERKSYAEILLDDIPKRIEMVDRKLRAGDIADAERERAEVEKFIDSNRAELHKFTRYTGRDPLTQKAAATALGLATGSWLSDDQKALFDPMNNGRSVQGWASKVGASPRLAEVMEAARHGDIESNAILRATGADFRSVVSDAAPEVDESGRRKMPVQSAIGPAELDAFVKFHDTLTASVMPNVPANSLTPDDMAGFSKKLFTASKDGNPAALGAMTRSFSGILPTDDPETVKSKMRSGMEAATAVAGVAATKSLAAKSMLPAIADAIDSIKGGATRISGSVDRLKSAVDRTLSAVDTYATLGNAVSQDQVARLARIEYSREISDPTVLRDPSEQGIATQLQTAANLRNGLLTTDDPRSQLSQTREIDPRTGREFIRTASPDEAYPGLSVVKKAMGDALSRAEASVGLNGGDIVQEMQKNRGRIASVLVPTADVKDQEQAKDSAADMMIRYWTTEGRADMRTLYDDMYKKYHVDVDKASVEDTRAKLSNPKTATEVMSAAKAAAASGVQTADKRLFRRIESGEVDLTGKGDFKPGDPTWNSFVKNVRTEMDTLVKESTSPLSPVGQYVSGLKAGYVLDPKNKDTITDELTRLISESVFSGAGKLSSGFSKPAVDAASSDLAKLMVQNISDSGSLKALASGTPDAFLGNAVDGAAAYNELLFGRGDRFFSPEEFDKSGIPNLGLEPELLGGADTPVYRIRPENARSAVTAILTAHTLKAAAGEVTSDDPRVSGALAATAGVTAGGISLGSSVVPVLPGAAAPLTTYGGQQLGRVGVNAALKLVTGAGLGEATVAAGLIGVAAADVALSGYALYNAGLERVQPKNTTGLAMRIKQYAVSMMGAPTMDPPSRTPVGVQAPSSGPRAAYQTPQDISRLTGEGELLGSLSPEMFARFKESVAPKSGYYAGGAVNWNLSGDQIVAGMNVIKATTDAAKRPVEDNIVRSIFSEMKNDPTAYEYAQAAAARVKGPLTRGVALKVRSDAIKLAEYERAQAKGMSESRRLILSMKLKDLAAKRKGDEETSTPGLTDEEFDRELTGIDRWAQAQFEPSMGTNVLSQ